MPFELFRDGGEWSAYEVGEAWGGRLRARKDAEAEVRRLQRHARDAARAAIEIAQAKLHKAEAALARPVRIVTIGDGQ